MMEGLEKKTLNLEELLIEVSDYREFFGEDGGGELHEDELDFVAAARAIPDYQEFLKKAGQKRENGRGVKI